MGAIDHGGVDPLVCKQDAVAVGTTSPLGGADSPRPSARWPNHHSCSVEELRQLLDDLAQRLERAGQEQCSQQKEFMEGLMMRWQSLLSRSSGQPSILPRPDSQSAEDSTTVMHIDPPQPHHAVDRSRLARVVPSEGFHHKPCQHSPAADQNGCGLAIPGHPLLPDGCESEHEDTFSSMHMRPLRTGVRSWSVPATQRPDMSEAVSKAEAWRDYINSCKSPKRKRGRRSRLIPEDLEASGTNYSVLQRLTQSRVYELLSGTLILLNAIFIGWQTEYMSETAQSLAAQGLSPAVVEPVHFLAIQALFCTLFGVDLVLRWCADGALQFFQTSDRYWNMFDIFVVLFSFVDFFFALVEKAEAGATVLSNISVLRVMRVIRIVRVAKIIRVMRFFRELRMMVYSILGSLKSLLWSLMVLTAMFFIFGISLTMGTIEHLDTPEMWRDEKNTILLQRFGSLRSSILSLYMAMSGGRNWGDLYDILQDLPMTYRALFLVFITFAIFAVVNIVTGIFVENALQSQQTDRDIIVQEELESKREYFRQMKEVFDELDDDNTGCISEKEFEAKLNDERVIAYFNALKLDVNDAHTLFMLLDYDQSGEISIEEFVAGCHKLKGESRSLDIAIIQYEVLWLKEAFLGFADFAERCLNSSPSASPRMLSQRDAFNERIATAVAATGCELPSRGSVGAASTAVHLS
uniref:EF-hand domain-containing protein n=1 Tax=Pyrodinium bahamense TaxID=73915 RepID=A0A7S0B6Y0_9DINO